MSAFLTLREYLLKPSMGNFEAILRFFENYPNPKERPLAIEYTREHLGKWPDKERVLRSFTPEHPAWILVRHLKLKKNMGRPQKEKLHGLNLQETKKLFDNTDFSNITALSLHCSSFSEDFSGSLLNATSWKQMSFLHMEDASLSELNENISSQVKELSLSGIRYSRQGNMDSSDFHPFPKLEKAFLQYTSEWDLSLFFQRDLFPKLETLALPNNQITDSFLEAFSKTPVANQLSELVLSRNELTDHTISLLQKSEIFPKLETLVLDLNGWTQEGKEELWEIADAKNWDLFLA